MTRRKDGSESFTLHTLKDLKKILKQRRITLSCNPSPGEDPKHVEDDTLFSDAMKDVREIKEFRNLRVYKKRASLVVRRCSQDNESLNTLKEIVSGKIPLKLRQTQEYVEWISKEYSNDIVERLHEGKFSVQDTLDLHGTLADEAEAKIASFLREASIKRFRCIKIIHGRGLRSRNAPVLKRAVVSWLSGRYRRKVIAFVTARQCDGGLGALYVLLR
jgi:DNA-nicking Smr family endonuclease